MNHFKTSAILAAAAALLAGCATSPNPTAMATSQWRAIERTDEFTDQRWCRVQQREANRLFPTLYYIAVIEKRQDGLRVGLASSGRYNLPVGTVRMRIDDNEAWTITPDETPIDSGSEQYAGMRRSLEADGTPQGAAASSAIGETSRAVQQMVSPYTVATGDKARAILEQMRTGRRLIYQTVGINAAASSTGRIELGPELIEALARCGIE